MKKAKLMLSAIAVFAVVGGAFAFKTAKTNRQLFYLNQGACKIRSSVTTAPGAVTVSLPLNATGWYTTPVCTGATFRAYAIPD